MEKFSVLGWSELLPVLFCGTESTIHTDRFWGATSVENIFLLLSAFVNFNWINSFSAVAFSLFQVYCYQDKDGKRGSTSRFNESLNLPFSEKKLNFNWNLFPLIKESSFPFERFQWLFNREQFSASCKLFLLQAISPPWSSEECRWLPI